MADPYNNAYTTGVPLLPQDTIQQAYGGLFYDDFLPAPTPQEDPLAPVEEDKRRRNTAASARFRVKKKERELALEKSAAEMTERVQELEGKVHGLETENKWLRGLIVEKSRSGGVEEGKRERESPAGKRPPSRSANGKGGEKVRSPSKHTDGVGTRS